MLLPKPQVCWPRLRPCREGGCEGQRGSQGQSQPTRLPSSQAWSAAADALAYLAELHLVCHDPRHDDSLIQGVEQPFHKVVLLLLGHVLEPVTDLLQASHGLKPQLDVLLGGNDADLGGDQEAQGPTRPWHSVEQV